MEFENNKTLEIYDWKIGKNYLGEDGMSFGEIAEWHLNGINNAKECLETIYELVRGNDWEDFEYIRKKLFFNLK